MLCPENDKALLLDAKNKNLILIFYQSDQWNHTPPPQSYFVKKFVILGV